MRTLIVRLCWIILLLGTHLEAQERGTASTFGAALDAFRQGNFSAANALYLKAIQEGRDGSASVYYNLGGSLYKNKELGASIAAHLRAAALAPRNPDVRYNLKFLLDKTQDKLSWEFANPGWRRWSAARWFGERPLLAFTVLAWAAALLILGRYLRSGRQPQLMIGSSLLLSLLGVHSALSLGERLWWTPDWGAVAIAKVDVLASPTAKNAVVIFQLHEGAPFAVLDESGDWLKIRLADAKTGWILREHLAVFGKRYFSYQMPKPASPGPEVPL